mmetsp:Transcript_13672/g.33103  ORF Transcript_13672/g.33103 Transcript_13672/m.33103 type:complete len:86 (-) Transcript_13672:45-302(-)
MISRQGEEQERHLRKIAAREIMGNRRTRVGELDVVVDVADAVVVVEVEEVEGLVKSIIDSGRNNILPVTKESLELYPWRTPAPGS